jgi:hypothetical protein
MVKEEARIVKREARTQNCTSKYNLKQYART